MFKIKLWLKLYITFIARNKSKKKNIERNTALFLSPVQAGTWRLNNVESKWRCIDVDSMLYKVNDVDSTLYKRQRWFDVV